MSERSRDRIVEAFARELTRMPVPPRLRAQAMSAVAAGRPVHERQRQSWLLVLVAAALAVAIVATLVFTAQRIRSPHGSVPATNQHPVAIFPPPQHFNVVAPGAAACNSSNCQLNTTHFVSANVGWLTENLPVDTSSPACKQVCPETSVLFRTDAGSDWKAVMSWDGVASQILGSPDGSEVLVVSPQSDKGGALLHSTDGGAHWTSFGLPAGAGEATQQMCKIPNNPCVTLTLDPQVYFISPREGWVWSQEKSYVTVDLFHTTDSGASWSAIRIDISSSFSIDVNTQVDKFGNNDHVLRGQVVFQDSSTGWFIPVLGFDIYVTHDGGATWHKSSLPKPAGWQTDWVAYVEQAHPFSDGHGAVDLEAAPATAGSSVQYTYSTADGGDNWTDASRLPTVAPQPGTGSPYTYVRLDHIDANHWIGFPSVDVTLPGPSPQLMRTSDAGKHWELLPVSIVVEQWFEFLDPVRGWALLLSPTYQYPYLARTADGGITWTPVSLPELT